MKTPSITHVLLSPGLHGFVYFGTIQGDKFKSIINTTRHFDRYHIVATQKTFKIENSHIIQECVLPNNIVKLVIEYVKNLNHIATNLQTLQFSPSQSIRDHKSVLRKADFLIVKQTNDYAGCKEYYVIINNNTGSQIRVSIERNQWQLSKVIDIPEYGQYIELSENEFNEILHHVDIAYLKKYWQLSDTMLNFIGYIFGINRWYHLYDYPKM